MFFLYIAKSSSVLHGHQTAGFRDDILREIKTAFMSDLTGKIIQVHSVTNKCCHVCQCTDTMAHSESSVIPTVCFVLFQLGLVHVANNIGNSSLFLYFKAAMHRINNLRRDEVGIEECGNNTDR